MRLKLLVVTSLYLLCAQLVLADEDIIPEQTQAQENVILEQSPEVVSTQEPEAASTQENDYKPVQAEEPELPVIPEPTQTEETVQPTPVEVDVVVPVQENTQIETSTSSNTPEIDIVTEMKHHDYHVKHIANQGESLFLNDYSGWSVGSDYRDIAAQWQQGDTIRLFYETYYYFFYRVELRNLTRNESVYGTCKEIPNAACAEALFIAEIEDNSSTIKLSDGTILKTLTPSEVKDSQWKTGDLITYMFWGEIDGKQCCALWDHDTNNVIGEMMLLKDE